MIVILDTSHDEDLSTSFLMYIPLPVARANRRYEHTPTVVEVN